MLTPFGCLGGWINKSGIGVGPSACTSHKRKQQPEKEFEGKGRLTKKRRKKLLISIPFCKAD